MTDDPVCDAAGQPLKEGDTVFVRCRVLAVERFEDGTADVLLRPIDPDWPDAGYEFGASRKSVLSLDGVKQRLHEHIDLFFAGGDTEVTP